MSVATHAELKSIVFNEAIFEMADSDAVDLSTHTFMARLCRDERSGNSHPGHHASVASELNTNIRKDKMTEFTLLDHVFNGQTGGHNYAITDGASPSPAVDDQVLLGVSIAKVENGNNNYIEFKAQETTWPTVAGSGVLASGVLIYRRITTYLVKANDIPLCFIKFTAEIDPDSSDLTVKWGGTASASVSGIILKLQQG